MRLDAVVVGGGQAGLAMAWHLQRRGLRFVVLDAGARPGQVWRSRWDSLRLFTPARYNALPGMASPGPADAYPTKDPVADGRMVHRRGIAERRQATVAADAG
jgi:putative flavoprotein involved in K+ transport